MGLFSLFKKKPVIKESSIPSLNNPYVLPIRIEDFKEWHIKVLRRLDKHPKEESFSGIMTKEVDISKFIPILENLDLITTASYIETLSLLTVEDLKQILRENNQKVSGKKQELIERITSYVGESELINSTAYREFYVLTDKGRDAIDSCSARFDEEHMTFFKNTVLLIANKNFNASFQMICRKNAEMPVSPGLGVDWSQREQCGIDPKTKQLYSQIISNSADTILTAIALYSEMSGTSIRQLELYTQKAFPEINYTLDDICTEYSKISVKESLEDYVACDINKYIFLATLDKKTCPVCGALDHKSFLVKDAVIGKNCPPMHSGCRCTTIAYIPSKELAQMQTRIRNPKTGKTETVPGNMTYKQWKKIYLDQ